MDSLRRTASQVEVERDAKKLFSGQERYSAIVGGGGDGCCCCRRRRECVA